MPRFTILLLLLLTPLRATAAPVLYTYTGDPLLQTTGSLTAADRVTGWVVFADPLDTWPDPRAPITSLVSREVLAYAFTVGGFTIDDTSDLGAGFALAAFDGWIGAYWFRLTSTTGVITLSDISTIVQLPNGTGYSPIGRTGFWSLPQPYHPVARFDVAAVPTPGPLALLGVAGLILLVWRAPRRTR